MASVELPFNIQNVVASASLNQNLDLNSLVRISPGAEYKPEEFPGLIYRLHKPRTVTLIFGSGRMVCAGAKSERSAKQAVQKVIDEMRNNGIVILAQPEIAVQNIVATADLGCPVDLEDSAVSLRGTIYEPEIFPGLIYRMDNPHVSILLFRTGKFVIAGAKDEDEVRVAVNKLRSMLEDNNLLSKPEDSEETAAPNRVELP